MDELLLEHAKQSGRHATKASKTMMELFETSEDH